MTSSSEDRLHSLLQAALDLGIEDAANTERFITTRDGEFVFTRRHGRVEVQRTNFLEEGTTQWYNHKDEGFKELLMASGLSSLSAEEEALAKHEYMDAFIRMFEWSEEDAVSDDY